MPKPVEVPPRIRTFVVLGAGASYGARAGAPHPGPPPLGPHLAAYLERWYALNSPDQRDGERVNDWLVRESRMDYELDTSEPASDLWDGGDRRLFARFFRDARARRAARSGPPVGFERAVVSCIKRGRAVPLRRRRRHNEATFLWRLQRLVAFAMLMGVGCTFGERSDGFDDLFRRIGLDGVGLISVNYDLLAEEALGRGGAEIRYPGLRSLAPRVVGIPAYKLHGSVNWIAIHGKPMSVSGPQNSPDTQYDYVPGGGRPNLIAELKHSHTNHVILAAYGPGKPSTFNYTALARQTRCCLAAIKANPTASVVVIGVSRPQGTTDDPRLHQVARALSRIRGRREYVGPCVPDQRAWAELGFSLAAPKLEEFEPRRGRMRRAAPTRRSLARVT